MVNRAQQNQKKEFIPYDKLHGPGDNITSYSQLDLFYLFFTHDILKYLADQTSMLMPR